MSVSERREERKRRRKQRERTLLGVALVLVTACVLLIAGLLRQRSKSAAPGGGTQTAVSEAESIPAGGESDGKAEAVLLEYMDRLTDRDFTGMYELLSAQSREKISGLDFLERNEKIYDGIEAEDLRTDIMREVSVKTEGDASEGKKKVDADTAVERTFSYTQTMDSVAGKISFDNEATLVLEEGEWRLVWDDSLIFPDLVEGGAVRINSTPAARGRILDRNGDVLAGTGLATSVGLVRGEMAEDSAALLAEVLGISLESIENKMSAGWVTDDVFVPIKTVEKLTDEEILSGATEATRAKQERDQLLTSIPGVQLQDEEIRTYPLGEAAAHLVGYVQNISAEELQKDTKGYYISTSQIGKVGLESLYEERLRGKPGKRIRIQNDSGDTIKILAASNPVDGEDIVTTIDSDLQRQIYEVYRSDPSATVAMNPYSGEVLALVSTPSYDNNLFILGLSQKQWDAWNNDSYTPLNNRFRAVWAPGSSFKPVTAAIGMTNGSIDPTEHYSTSTAWQQDSAWGSYQVTTLHEASPGTVEQALVVSDNVWFAKAAVRMGAEALEESWKKIGFGEQLAFPIQMRISTFSNTEHVDTEIQLADSGYGQGEIQVNPLHLAVIYSAFCNQGSMIQPRLELQTDKAFWKENVFSEEACERVTKALVKAVEHGTGTGAQVSGLTIAGKTGTAELKLSQDDITGTELGWFAAFTPELPEEEALLTVTMVEGVKYLGGSGYVTPKSGAIFSWYCLGNALDDGLPDRDNMEAGRDEALSGLDYGLQWDEDIDEQELGMIDE